MALSVALGLSTFVVIWLIQPAAQARGVPLAWFGPLGAGAHVWLALVSLASARVVGALRVRGRSSPAASSRRSATWASPPPPRLRGSGFSPLRRSPRSAPSPGRTAAARLFSR
jgi:hypothetical protein